ncbi:OmpA family protein [uncultured Jannaschia sp.]|uniref:OmpA family protein n=1 Tax=uncultured Jannaschia sp. TaxID=293347 RepID=UPI002609FCB7|nr:OmpA family protein [uncultured Jannaschia sp.]
MIRKRTIVTFVAFTFAVAASAGGALVAADYLEDSSRAAAAAALGAEGLDWVEVETDGLQLVLRGTAPDEPARFRAITAAGAVVDASRVIDQMQVAPARPVTPPRFSLEILRNDTGVSLIGLVPAEGGPEAIDDLLAEVGGDALEVTNMVETADHPVPDDWTATLRFAMAAIEEMPRAKISVEPGRVTVTAVADSDAAKRALEGKLEATTPEGVALTLDIAAPRPVIAPFTLRYVMPATGLRRLTACAVDSAEAEARIVAALRATGFEGKTDCVMGLGVPSANWGEAAALGIEALDRLGGGSLTLSDADVSLVTEEGVAPDLFDTVASELETALPELFVLSAVRPEPADADGTDDAEPAPEFVATLAPEGQVELRGRLYDEAQKAAVVSYGRGLFGVANTYVATRADSDLPEGWPARVLAGMEGLSRLASGTAVVQPDLVVLRGVTGNAEAEAEIAGLLSDKLGAEADYRIEVTYDEELDPLLNIPTPEECETRLNAILTEQKLTFAPGEPVIEAAGEGQIGRLADQLDTCKRAYFEIGGHTDSQGREVMNLELSQARAEAVRNALVSRGVSPRQLVAEGYGETQPIADNGTEAGREANRRITFTLLGRREQEDWAASPRITAPQAGERLDDAAVEAATPATPEAAADAATQPEDGTEGRTE